MVEAKLLSEGVQPACILILVETHKQASMCFGSDSVKVSRHILTNLPSNLIFRCCLFFIHELFWLFTRLVCTVGS